MWVLPSLNRVEQLKRLLARLRETGVSTPGLVLLGPHQQPDLAGLDLPAGWRAICQDEADASLAPAMNRVFRDHPGCEWYGILADDNWPETPGWDRVLVDAALAAGMAYANDRWQAPKHMRGAIAFHGDLLRAFGWWYPPCVKHSFADDFWEGIARRFGCSRYLPDVVVEHRHPLHDHRVAPDETYTRQFAWLEKDRAAFGEFMRSHDYSAICARVAARFPSAEGDAQRARLERAKSRSVMICVPVARNPVWQFTLAYAETCVILEKLGIGYASRFIVGSSNLARARNVLVARALAKGMTDLLFIDDDMGWTPNDVVRLLASEREVIGAVGRKKAEKPDSDPDVWCVKFLPGSNERLRQDEMGNVEVERIGTGFLKIDLAVFRRLAAAHPEWKLPGDDGMDPAVRENYYQFFRFGDAAQGDIGEDYVFCDRWRALGGSIWMDPTIRLTHVGDKAYSGAIVDIMQAAAAADPARSAAA